MGISWLTSSLPKWLLLLFRLASAHLHDGIQPQPQRQSPVLNVLSGRARWILRWARLVEESIGLKEHEARSQTKEKAIATVTLTGPVVAPAGTVVVRLLVVAAATVAVVLLNFTVLPLGVALKFCP